MSWRAVHQPRRRWHIVIVIIVSLVPLFSFNKAYAVGQFVRESPVSIATNNAKASTATLPAGAAAGDLLVLVCSVGTAATVSATGYTAAAPSVSGTVSQGIFYKLATAGETTATCDSTVRTKTGVGAQLYEYSGMAVVGVFDVAGTASGTGTAVSSGSATPTSLSSLVFTAFTAAAGTTYSGVTAGYTKRADTFSLIHLGQADRFTVAMTAQSAAATNSTSSAWRGQVAVFKVSLGTRGADIVDASGVPVASPAIGFADVIFDLGCNFTLATLGTSTQKIRITNTTPYPAWSVNIAATNGATDYWFAGGNDKYDFNDPTVDGCTDGADADSLAGKLFVDSSTGTVTPVGGCGTTGITLSPRTGFSEGTQDSIALVTAGSGAQTGCTWDVTGITLNQYIPAEQNAGTYSIGLTLTFLAS